MVSKAPTTLLSSRCKALIKINLFEAVIPVIVVINMVKRQIVGFLAQVAHRQPTKGRLPREEEEGISKTFNGPRAVATAGDGITIKELLPPNHK